MKRTAQFKAMRKKGLELYNIAKNEPRKFWSAIKPNNRSKCSIDNTVMMNHFKNTLGSNPPELCHEVFEIVDNVDFSDINVDY